mmetsp:Transcript_121261/g.302632  ORF Transcript_121261/g.302632 Transcript_121261/m.302632 type:complete len:98 (-) Transcript_121261:375-668(-)
MNLSWAHTDLTFLSQNTLRMRCLGRQKIQLVLTRTFHKKPKHKEVAMGLMDPEWIAEQSAIAALAASALLWVSAIDIDGMTHCGALAKLWRAAVLDT